MSTSRLANESSPDSFGESVAVPKPHQPLRLSSFAATLNVRGSAMNTTLSTSTAAMSSSSAICESCAASMSSRAIPKETENARSALRPPKAVAVSVIAPDNCADSTELVYRAAVDTALREMHQLPPRLAWQVPRNGGAFLVVRRLLVAPRGLKRGTGSGGPMRALHGRHMHQTQHFSAGTVFGCTLGNLMHHSCNADHTRPLFTAMRTLRRALVPAGRALGTCTGADTPFLVKGMMCHRVLTAQGRRLRELKQAPAIDHNTGHVGVVVGISAAILVAFECMAADANDCDGLGAQLSSCLREAQIALVGWRMPHVCDNEMHDAHGAEVRALERARIGVARAHETGRSLAPAAAMRLQLDCYRRAVWPQGEELSPDTHESVLKRIHTGELVDLERDASVAGSAPPGIATLSALSALPAHGAPTAGSVSDSRSATGSSWSSFASSIESETGATPQISPDMQRLAAAIQMAVLTPAARTVVAPPPSISSRPVLESVPRERAELAARVAVAGVPGPVARA